MRIKNWKVRTKEAKKQAET